MKENIMDYPELNTLLILGIIFLVAVSIGLIALLLKARLSLTARIIILIILVVCILGALFLAYALYLAVTPGAELLPGLTALLACRRFC
jgi:uncharacterized membrane protein